MVKMITSYCKRCGLPGYSSHQFSISVETELTDLGEVESATTRLYRLLQDSVDAEIRATGFVPPQAYGMENGTGNSSSNGNGAHASNGNGYRNGTNGHDASSRIGDRWNCTDGQKGLILRVVNEGKIEKMEVEQMAQQLFGVGVKQCDKSQASQLIEQLLEKTGKKTNGSRWRRQPAGARS